jgi:RimJ/RimL family protein N-acetyltransferase
MSLIVRESTLNDVPLIVDYWLSSSDEHLEGMGVDLSKLPDKTTLEANLINALKTKKSYCLIWEYNNKPIGHTNANKITIGKEAHMHLHLWQQDNRQKGLGLDFIKQSLPFYFKTLQLETLYCEPYSSNPAPNKTLKKAGFRFIKTYKTSPVSLNIKPDVKQWKRLKEEFIRLYRKL